MSASEFADDWLSGKLNTLKIAVDTDETSHLGPDATHSIDVTLSWATRISRTRVSTVDGLGFSDSVDATTIHSLEGVLRAVEQLKIPRCLNDQIEEVRTIGQGETFTVLECKFESKLVAVKHIKLENHNNSTDRHAFQRRLQSVLREISIMHHSPLAHHPNIVDLIGYGWRLQDKRPAPYVVVELGSGGSLRTYLTSRFLPIKAKMILAGDVACGLMALHQCGIIHGDLKLDNVIVFPSLDRPSGSIAKICDFGHSILQSTSGNKPLKYYGTTLYNAPEVAKQKSIPIDRESLHKCDIWAYGLLVWEILANGATFFKKSWRHDPALACTLEESLPSISKESSTTAAATSSGLREASIDADEDRVLGSFDVRHLKLLAKQYVNAMENAGSGFEKSYLRPLFERTLQEDAAVRLSSLTSLPIIGIWNKTSGTSSLQSRLALYTGTSSFTYGVFSRDSGPSILWGHQQQMLQDFEAASMQRQIQDSTNPAAFQTAMCYINAFGTSADYDKGVQHLRRAEESKHLLAKLFGRRISNAIGQLPLEPMQPYSAVIAHGFRMQRTPERSSKITLFYDKGDKTVTNPFFALDRVLEIFSSYEGFTREVLNRNYSKSKLAHLKVAPASSTMDLNLFELGIFYGDADFVQRLVQYRPLHSILSVAGDETLLSLISRVGAWGETALIQAARCGSSSVLRVLLKAGADPRVQTTEGCSIFHWLFCFEFLDDDIIELLFCSVAGNKTILNHPCATNSLLHPQWPFSIRGTPLAIATSVGNHGMVKVLLGHGADPRVPAFSNGGKEPSEWTAVHLAIKYRFLDILRTLLDTASSLAGQKFESTPGLKGSLPLCCAVSFLTPAEGFAIHGKRYKDNLCNMIDMLPRKWLYQSSSFGKTPLLQAIDVEDVGSVRVLLDRCQDLAWMPLVDPDKPANFTYPLHFAAQVGSRRDTRESLQIVECICEVDLTAIDKGDSSSRTALHLAVTGLSSTITECLVRYGANIEAVDEGGQTPLHYCRFASNTSFLLDNGAKLNRMDKYGFAAIHIAARAALEGPLQELLKRKADLQWSSNSIGSPLHCAIHRKSYIATSMLLEAGAAVNAVNVKGETPLLAAIESGRIDLVLLLLHHGANPFLKNHENFSPLRAALNSQSPAILRKFLQHAGAKRLSKKELTPLLHWAAAYGQPNVLREFLRHYLHSEGTNIDDTDDTDDLKSRTPLHTAAMLARADAADILLAHGAKVNAKDSEGNTALLLACRRVRKDVLEHRRNPIATCGALVNAGADLLAKNNFGWNALTAASANDDLPLMTFLIQTASLSCRGTKPSNIGLPNEFDKPDPESKLFMLTVNVPIGCSVLETAKKKEEWDFIMVCIAAGVVSREDFLQVFNHISSSEIRSSQIYARRGDRAMITWALDLKRREVSFYGMSQDIAYGARNFSSEWSESRRISPQEPESSSSLSALWQGKRVAPSVTTFDKILEYVSQPRSMIRRAM